MIDGAPIVPTFDGVTNREVDEKKLITAHSPQGIKRKGNIPSINGTFFEVGIY